MIRLGFGPITATLGVTLAKFAAFVALMLVVGGRLYLNYDTEIQEKWEADIPGHIARADAPSQRSVWLPLGVALDHFGPKRCMLASVALTAFGAAAFAEPDGSGRISIPASQRSAVGIEKKAVLLGMGDKFELWSEQAHHAQIRQTLGDADLGEDLLDLAL